MEDVHALAKGARTTVSRVRHANGSLREAIEGEPHCRTRARLHGTIIMPASEAMKRKIISVIAQGRWPAHPSVGSISAGQR